MTSDFPARFRLDGKMAVVTGAGSGIGRAAAIALGEAGAAVAVLDRNSDAAQTVSAELQKSGCKAVGVAADVTREQDVAAAFRTAEDDLGRTDVLVNSAGIAIRAPAVELTLADWDKVVAVNLTGVFLCAREAARSMIAGGRGGSIVNIASMMGLSGGLYPNVSYQSSKGGVVNLTRALAIEWASAGIRVNAVAPTWVRTALTAALLDRPGIMDDIRRVTPLRRIAEPEEVAAAILYLASPAASMVTGHTLAVDGGYLAQ